MGRPRRCAARAPSSGAGWPAGERRLPHSPRLPHPMPFRRSRKACCSVRTVTRSPQTTNPQATNPAPLTSPVLSGKSVPRRKAGQAKNPLALAIMAAQPHRWRRTGMVQAQRPVHQAGQSRQAKPFGCLPPNRPTRPFLPILPPSEAVARARTVATAVAFARDLINTPSARKSPQWLADQATELAERCGLRRARARRGRTRRGRFRRHRRGGRGLIASRPG